MHFDSTSHRAKVLTKKVQTEARDREKGYYIDFEHIQIKQILPLQPHNVLTPIKL